MAGYSVVIFGSTANSFTRENDEVIWDSIAGEVGGQYPLKLPSAFQHRAMELRGIMGT